jgi:hypothetical protein
MTIGDVMSSPAVAVRRRCLRCGGEHLRPVQTAGDARLLCFGCQRCWQLEEGYLVEVNPLACSGCPHRRLCLGR